MKSFVWNLRDCLPKTHGVTADFYLGILLFFCVFLGLLFFFGIHFSLVLLLGPLLYGFIGAKDFKNFLLHCLPFIFYQVLNLDQVNNIFPIDISKKYFLLTGISLGIYAVLSLIVMNRSRYRLARRKLGSQLSILFLLCSFFIVVQGLEGMTNIQLGFDPEYMIVGILLFSSLIIYLHLYGIGISEVKEIVPDLIEKKKSALALAVSVEYLEKLKGGTLKEEIFLNSNLTLERLSKELEIPKHHLSKCLKIYLNTNFYEFIAELRIKYAVKQIESGNAMTLESLAYECGFNSKTSFNKYFKEYTGILPSEYRRRFVDY